VKEYVMLGKKSTIHKTLTENLENGQEVLEFLQKESNLVDLMLDK
jgi:hypothetical protein